MSIFEVLVLLIAGHFIFDYVWQGLYLSTIKNPTNVNQDIHWSYPMFVHSFLHATAVLMITRLPMLFFLELVIHFSIDYAKCKKQISHGADQTIHLVCKLVWFSIYLTTLSTWTVVISAK